MAGTVNQYQQSAFTSPVNGDALDASVPLSNDNAVRGKHNSHDADATIHIQSSDLASRPAAGTPQRAWWTTDEFRVYFDYGGAWNPLKVRAADVLAGTFAGNFVISGSFGINDATTPVLNLTIAGVTNASLTVDSGALIVGTPALSGNTIDLATNGTTTRVQVPVSVAAGDVFLLVYDQTGALLKQVSRGAADSGGTGYRLLRIPN